MSPTSNESASASLLEDVPRLDVRALLAAIPLIGLILLATRYYLIQITQGVGLVAGLNRPTYWGLDVVNCVFFLGVGAGGVIISSLVHALGMRELKAVARIAELMSISSAVMAMSSLFANLCWPTRMIYILQYPHLTSPIFWDMTNLSTYLVISLVYGYLGARADLVRVIHEKPRYAPLYRFLSLGYTDLSPEARNRDQRILRVLGAFVLVGELAEQTISAWLFGLHKARPGWYGGMITPLFLVFATISALAVLTTSVVVTRRMCRLRIDDAVIRRLGKYVLFLIPVLGYLLFVELVTVLYAAVPARLDVYHTMMFGLYAPMFWGHLTLGLLFPLFLLMVILLRASRRMIWTVGLALVPLLAITAARLHLPVPYPSLWHGLPGWTVYALLWVVGLALLNVCNSARMGEDLRIGLATLLVAAGVFAGRWNIIISSLMGYSYLPFVLPKYVPTLREILVIVGVCALGGLIYIGCVSVLPLVDSEGMESNHRSG